MVPDGCVFEDEGWSGATLIRPGLERMRDLAAQGQVETVLVYSPDRLSRKDAYQVLLVEEFGRHGVDLVFLQGPRGETPEDVLLLQFQGLEGFRNPVTPHPVAHYGRPWMAQYGRPCLAHYGRP